MLLEMSERKIGNKMYSKRDFSFTLEKELFNIDPNSAISGQK